MHYALKLPYIIDRCSFERSIIRTWTDDLHANKIDGSVNTLCYNKQRLYRELHDTTCMEFAHLYKYNKNYKNY